MHRLEGILAVTLALVLMALPASTVTAVDDPPPPVGSLGACCLGEGLVQKLTYAECMTVNPDGIWILGDYDPTQDRSPCDLLPGGD